MKDLLGGKMNLKVLPNEYSVCRLPPTSPVPTWVYQSPLYTISKTDDELSLLCRSDLVQNVDNEEKSFRAIKVMGPLDFSLTGILYSLAKPLAENKISIFAVSTFDTDYLLLKTETLETGIDLLKQEGFQISH